MLVSVYYKCTIMSAVNEVLFESFCKGPGCFFWYIFWVFVLWLVVSALDPLYRL